ncbi:MAG: helix-turn-helix transcriptional regulator, partial [Treponema sp.]|nr:helix-turn-helix transcriptional regulator [Treponema sp.]
MKFKFPQKFLDRFPGYPYNRLCRYWPRRWMFMRPLSLSLRNKINDFLLDCGNYRDAKEFSRRILDRIGALIPFDQGRLYFLNDNGSVCDEYLVGIDKQTVKEYHEYYSKVDDRVYSTEKRAQNFHRSYPNVADCIMDWSVRDKTGVFGEYVRFYGIQRCFGLGLRDLHNNLKCLFTLDRVRDIDYSEDEVAVMSQIRPYLDNLYQNFYVRIPDNHDRMNGGFLEDLPLSAREIEIAELLKQGIIPANISERLFVSGTTVKKHIANIHAKLNVSTRQELIVKLFK